jgi:glycosyltransferase involved in cell wall biosynthesis
LDPFSDIIPTDPYGCVGISLYVERTKQHSAQTNAVSEHAAAQKGQCWVESEALIPNLHYCAANHYLILTHHTKPSKTGTKNLRILHIISSVDPRGGGPIEGVVSSSQVWFQHGHERHILCLDPPDAPWVRQCSVPTFAVGFGGWFYRFLRRIFPWLRYGYTPKLSRWLKTYINHYDAVVVNGLWNYASYGSWRALHTLDTPYFVFTHGMLDPWFNTAYPTKTFFKTLFWKLFEHKVLRDATGVLFTCEEERLLAARSFTPYAAREFVAGYGARDVSGDPKAQLAAFYAKLPAVRGRKLILFLSRIHEKKGVDLLIDAFARLAGEFPDFDLVIAGPDQVGLQARLARRATEKGVAPRIHWPGMLTGDAKWGAFRAAEFFVLPSHQENFGIVVAEAMALSRPVLITNKVNIWREIEQDGAGLVVDDEAEAIAAGLREMCALSSAEREAIGLKARKCFLERYDLERNAMQLLTLLSQISAGPEMFLDERAHAR